MNPRKRLVLNLMALALVGTSVAVLAFSLSAEDFLIIKGLVLVTFFVTGKFVVLAPVLEPNTPFSPFFLAGMFTTVYGLRWLNRERFRRQTVSAAGRVRSRALQNRFFRDRW